MSMPENALLSDDGQWWWDEDNQAWQAVDAGQAAGEPAFDFDLQYGEDNGLRVETDEGYTAGPDDPLKAGFSLCNTGTAGGSAHVVIEVDGQPTVEWDSPWLEPGHCTAPDGDGFVHGIPPLGPGEHKLEGIADPPGPGGGRSGVNTIKL